LNHAPKVHEFSQPNGRDRFLSLKEEALYSGKGSANLRGATILAVDTGMRPNSELFPLKWADVDLMARPQCPHGVIQIRQGKTVNAQRSLPLTPRAAEVLQRRKREAEAKDKPSAFVFPGAGNAGHIISLHIRRRMQLHGMIERIPKTHRHRVTPFGLRPCSSPAPIPVFIVPALPNSAARPLPTTLASPCSSKSSKTPSTLMSRRLIWSPET
jgi:integrase